MEGPRIDQNPRLAPAAAGLRLTILVWNDQKGFIKNREEFLNKPTFSLCQLVRLTIRERLKIS